MSVLTEEEVTRRLIKILAEILVVSPEDIHPGSLLVDELDADSIAFLELNYHLKSDFGITTPNPKVDESTLSMSAPDALRKIEAQVGGTTLFEFMKDEAVRAAAADPATRRALAGTLLGGLEDGGSVALLRAGLSAARSDAAARTLMTALLDDVAADPAAAARLHRAAEADAGLRDALAAFRDPAPGKPVKGGDRGNAFHEAILREMDLQRLARFMGGEVPAGMDPAQSVNSIRLRDLFRFITVQSYVQYVLFLGSGTGGAEEKGEADPGGADPGTGGGEPGVS